jgi:hypothetical protein
MTDREYFTSVMKALRVYAHNNAPMPPAVAEKMADMIELQLNELKRMDDAPPPNPGRWAAQYDAYVDSCAARGMNHMSYGEYARQADSMVLGSVPQTHSGHQRDGGQQYNTAGPLPLKCPHGVLKNGMSTCLVCSDPAFHAASRNNPSPYQTFTLTGETKQASASNLSLCVICGEPNFSIPRLGIGHVCKLKPNATYWRCIHHPSLIENMKDHRYVCEHGCHKSELRWYDNGTCKPLTS